MFFEIKKPKSRSNEVYVNLFFDDVQPNTYPRISYRNGWNTEALIFENLEPVEIPYFLI